MEGIRAFIIEHFGEIDFSNAGPWVIFAAFVAIMAVNAAGHRKAKKRAADGADQVQDLSRRVLVVSSETIPGREIKQVIGHVTGTAPSASRGVEAEAAEKLAMVNLMENAIAMGANAVIGARLSTSTYEEQGSQWQKSKLFYTGTAVVI